MSEPRNDNNLTEEPRTSDEPDLSEQGGAVAQEAAPTATDAESDRPSDELTQARAERDEALNRLARVQADFANARRRLEADTEQRLQFANSTLIKALLPVIDNWERALAVDPEKTDTAAVLKGLQVVHDQMMDVLARQNVEVIAPAEGEPFDPSRHEAVMQQESDKYPELSVLQTLQRGYALHGRTLRPASVVVSKPR
ncbi:MAG: nucleotide exchange factor GrpE [Phycisphaerae bacterium]|nr:nucleotide exchange factor GrpE [Phycisphaerae bacterium]MDW8262840.1 nucleotide exchange factor GrpE [Phycisphaerales bacterium]